MNMIRRIECPDEKMRIARLVLDKLPEWFGIPESTDAYVRGCAELPFWADGDRGFIAMRPTGDYAAEIFVMGVSPECHRMGIGKMLFEALRNEAKLRGMEYLHVKTVQTGSTKSTTEQIISTGAWASGSWNASRSFGTRRTRVSCTS